MQQLPIGSGVDPEVHSRSCPRPRVNLHNVSVSLGLNMDSKRNLSNLTLGTLKQPSNRVCLPSTLSYQERMHLKENDPVEYSRYRTLEQHAFFFNMLTYLNCSCTEISGPPFLILV